MVARRRSLFILPILAIMLAVLPLTAGALALSTYVVKPGDTLWGIARRFGVSMYTLARANHLSPSSYVYVGQRLVIPTRSSPATGGWYTVQWGDTLSGIAQRFGVSLNALAAANGLSPRSFVYAGQRLRIPGRSSSPAPPASGSTRGRVYIVRRGDTLSSIALRFGVSLHALVRANGLRNPSFIYVGQRLLIPGRTTPTSSPSPSPSGSGQGLRFVVDVSMQRCWLYRGASLLYEWPCSTGQRGYPTRYGTFHVLNKIPVAYGAVWNINMPYWLGIYWAGSLQNGIHGIPWNASTGVRVWRGYVGIPITFGCIMLDDTAARRLYELAYVGMPVIIRP